VEKNNRSRIWGITWERKREERDIV